MEPIIPNQMLNGGIRIVNKCCRPNWAGIVTASSAYFNLNTYAPVPPSHRRSRSHCESSKTPHWPAAKNDRPDRPGELRAVTNQPLFRLIASAGLRVSEAMDLLDSDVDLDQGLLTIRQALPSHGRCHCIGRRSRRCNATGHCVTGSAVSLRAATLSKYIE
jgi:integrase